MELRDEALTRQSKRRSRRSLTGLMVHGLQEDRSRQEVIGYQLLVIGYQLSVISYQLSVIGMLDAGCEIQLSVPSPSLGEGVRVRGCLLEYWNNGVTVNGPVLRVKLRRARNKPKPARSAYSLLLTAYSLLQYSGTQSLTPARWPRRSPIILISVQYSIGKKMLLFFKDLWHRQRRKVRTEISSHQS